MFSFHCSQECKAREAFLLMKQRRLEAKYSVSGKSPVEKQAEESKQERAMKHAHFLDQSLIDGSDQRPGRAESPSWMTGLVVDAADVPEDQKDQRRFSLLEERTQRMEEHEDMAEDSLKAESSKRATLPPQVTDGKKDEMVKI